jgi:hypothetical protein
MLLGAKLKEVENNQSNLKYGASVTHSGIGSLGTKSVSQEGQPRYLHYLQSQGYAEGIIYESPHVVTESQPIGE